MNIITNVRLYQNIPIGEHDTLIAASRDKLDAKFDEYLYAENKKCTLVRRGRTAIKFAIEDGKIPKDVNMLSYDNGDGRVYCRVMSSEYRNPKTCIITYMEDAWISFAHKCKYGVGIINRQHPTEGEWQAAITNPWRNDLTFLLTDEGHDFPETTYINSAVQTFPTIPKTSNTYVVLQVADWGSANNRQLTNDIVALTHYAYDPMGRFWRNTLPATVPEKKLDYKIPTGFWLLAFLTSEADGMGPDEKVWGSSLITELEVRNLNVLSAYYFYGPIFELFTHLNSNQYTDVITFGLTRPQLDDEITDPKALRAPYHFAEVTNCYDSSSGYQYEGFQGPPGQSQDEPVPCSLDYFPVFDDVPRAMMAPRWYYQNFLLGVISTPTFRQVGYSGDAFADFVATQMQTNLQTLNTLNTSYGSYKRATSDNKFIRAREMIRRTDSDSLGALGSALSANISASDQMGAEDLVEMGPLANAAVTGAAYKNAYLNSAKSNRETMALVRNAYQYKTDPIGSMEYFSPARPAFTNSVYIPPQGLGYPDYADYDQNEVKLGGGVFMIYSKRLPEQIMASVIKYFDMCGYVYEVIGTPNVITYLSTIDSDGTPPDEATLPHFTPSGWTYCQCQGLQVDGLDEDRCAAIENMFAAGVRFVKFETDPVEPEPSPSS